jgi:2-iminobutanoate/2-iminopropanoate deaminase
VARRSIEIASFQHSNPIPCATRIGPLLVSSVIVGRDPGSERVPDDPAAQYENCFHHIGEILREAGADWRHVARITFFVPDASYRAACNPIWLRHFPDPSDRPSRHTQVTPGAGPVTCELIAYVDD